MKAIIQNKIHKSLKKVGEKLLSIFSYLLFATTMFLLVNELFFINKFILNYKFKYRLLINFELPFSIFLSILFYFPFCRKVWLNILVSYLPLFILYLLHDFFFYYTLKSPTISDILNFHYVFLFSPFLGTLAIIVITTIPLLFIFSIIYSQKHLGKERFKNILKIKILFVLFFIFLGTFSKNKILSKFVFSNVSFKDTVRKNGRIFSFIYYSSKEIETKKLANKITLLDDKEIYKKIYPGDIKKTKNIYIVMMESFTDPRLIKGYNYSKDPVSPKLKPYLINGNRFSYTISPIYGGGTANAEFEIITGIKSFAKFGSIEFNLCRGGKSISLFNKLLQYNYTITTTIVPKLTFFNAKTAYKSYGIYNPISLTTLKSFQKNPNDRYIFDGDALNYNMEVINNSTSPFINYYLGMYGHFPLDYENLKDRPDVIFVKPYNKKIKILVNQFYYRTEAVGEYISKILSKDKNSIIFITSDHLPPIIEKEDYILPSLNHNISLLIVDSKTVDITGKHYYEIPWLIWDTLSENKKERELSYSDLMKIYEQVVIKCMTY
jgi:hypothetical protein